MNWMDWILDMESIKNEEERKTVEFFKIQVETLQKSDSTLNYNIYLNKINQLL